MLANNIVEFHAPLCPGRRQPCFEQFNCLIALVALVQIEDSGLNLVEVQHVLLEERELGLVLIGGDRTAVVGDLLL
ncbi:hypothetical protein D9M71_805180 [compost metagenome]